MVEILLIIANCAGIGASIFGFGITIWQMWEGVPTKQNQRQSQAKKTIVISIVFVALLIFLSFRLKNIIETHEQNGTFRRYSGVEVQIYYPIPYKFPPRLEFIKYVKSDGSTWGPEIIEQRHDGFKVKLDRDSFMYNWKAEGIIIDKK